MKFNAKRISLLSMLTAMASITFLIEGLFPPLFLPGAKMGLSNIFSVLAVVLLSPIDGIILVAVRTTLGSFIVGNLSSWVYSFTAGVTSVAVTGFLWWLLQNKVSLVSISVVGAVCHNIVQNVVYCLMTSTPELFAYLPYLAVLGVVAGLVVGFAVVLLLKSVPFDKMIDLDEQKI